MRPSSRAFLLPALALTVVILSGCAGVKTNAPGQPSASAKDPKELWNAFIAGSGEAASFTLEASLVAQSPQKSARLLATFRGNAEGPLRLDLASSLGQTYALWREGSDGWLAVYPLSREAFTHTSTKAALAKLGMPFPFGLKELAALATGRYGLFFPATYSSVKKAPQGYEYALPSSSPVATVLLDAQGKPLRFVSRGIEPWSVDLGDFSTEPGLQWTAQKISLTTPGGSRAILRVKKLTLSPALMDVKSLELPVPPGITVTPLGGADDVDMPPMP